MIKRISVPLSLLAVLLLAGPGLCCGPQITFRAYLDKRFWQPFAKYEDTVASGGNTVVKKSGAGGETGGANEAAYKCGLVPFAGFSHRPAGEALQKVRDAYADGAYDRAQAAIAEAGKAQLTAEETEELRLIDAKLGLRDSDGDSSNRTLLSQTRSKLEAFLRTSRVPALASEARGWLARVHYLSGEYASAVKMYLDELDRPDTVFTRECLVNSLHLIFPYNGSSARLADHLEEYFDTPKHALFVVYLVTNPVYDDEKERASMARSAQAVIRALQGHGELFAGTDLSDQLALALMRASMYMGDTRAALSYSNRIGADSKTARSTEFNWMVGACHFLLKEYGEAEGPLLKVVQSKETSPRELGAAARGLMGVYQKLGRPVDQLRAAFFYEKASAAKESGEPMGLYLYTSLPDAEWLLDAPYLLDVQLTDEELGEYLARYGEEAKQIEFQPGWGRDRTARDAVEYALAVRAARQERYEEAARIYESLNARPRAGRMRTLVEIHAKAKDTSLPPEQQMEAQYRYASFLEENSTRVFFNDMVWRGFQTWAFVGNEFTVSQGLTREERERFAAKERSVQDQQEERWRAYAILSSLVDRAGYTRLGKESAIKAIQCLDLIGVQRFGRADEIDRGRQKLLKWLKTYRSHVRKGKA